MNKKTGLRSPNKSRTKPEQKPSKAPSVMKPTTKETIKTIMQFAISVLTALGAQSCRGI